MQLSLSVSQPVPPESAQSGAMAADAVPGDSNQTGVGVNSFAAMLPADKAPAGPAVPAVAADTAKSTVILATACLMPGAQPGTASLLSPGGDAPAGDNPAAAQPEAFAFSNQSRPAGFFGPRAARTYAATGRPPVTTEPEASPAAKPCTDLETTSTILAASFVMPGVTLPLAPVPDTPTTMPAAAGPLAGRLSASAFSTPVGPLGMLAARSARASVPAASATPDATVVGAKLATDAPTAAVVPAAGGVVAPGDNVFPARMASGEKLLAAAQAVALSEGGEPAVPQAASQPVPETRRVPDGAPAAGTELTGTIVAGMTGQIPPAVQPRSTRSGTAPVSMGDGNALKEKNAAGVRALFPESATSDPADKKESLSTGHGAVTGATPAVGIGVAQVQSAMSANPFPRSKSAPTVAAVANGPMTFGTAPAPTIAVVAPAPVASLRETMAAVVTAVEALERHADSVQKSVDLQFKVGNEQLALRVELRDGTVHTTFRTDSTELRSALTHEWQSVVQPAAGGELRLADPVFSPAAAGNESALGSPGQGTPQQRGQNNPEPTPFTRPADFSVEATPATAAPAAPLVTSLLQAFA